MRQRCEYCDNWIEDTDEVCPHCGAPNAHMMASAAGVPKTIEELREFAERHNLPLQDMRVFIGEDYREPKAFGIYQDGEDFVVYKNKADGTRAVRYQGHDEAYAVNELYQKMKSEIANQRAYVAAKKMGMSQAQTKATSLLTKVVRTVGLGAVGLMIAVTIAVFVLPSGPSRGYYVYDNVTYYALDDTWYYYDRDDSGWHTDYSPPEELTGDADTYYTGSSWDSSGGTTDFENTSYYQTYMESNDWDSDDWDDSDWDWDSGSSWDSGSTNWDSDW